MQWDVKSCSSFTKLRRPKREHSKTDSLLKKPVEEVPSLKEIRRVRTHDVDDIRKLETTSTSLYFGDTYLERLIESAFFFVCVCNENDEIVGAICFNDYPNVPAIPSCDWVPWIHNLYRIDRIKERNTLFIHYMVWDNRYAKTFARPMLQIAFIENLYVVHIIFVAPPGVSTVEGLEDFSAHVIPLGFSSICNVQTLFVMLRQKIVTRYKIRRAVEEDNDDIVPLINKHSNRLQQMYGDYYISEIIAHYPDTNRDIIVSEYNETAVGVLCLTTDANYDILNEVFELTPYYGLHKISDDDQLPLNLKEEPSEIIDIMAPQCLEAESYIVEPVISDLLVNESPGEEMRSEEDMLQVASSAFSVGSEDDYSLYDVSSLHLVTLYNTSSVPEIATVESAYSVNLLSTECGDDVGANQINFRLKRNRVEYTHIPELTPIKWYVGPTNAFVIELMSAMDDREREITADLIEAAFECYPNCDYCVLTLPPTYPSFPLLQHFVRVPPKSDSTFPHELYVLHRNAMLGELSVRVGVKSDRAAVKWLVHNVVRSHQIISDFNCAIFQPDCPYKAYVLCSEETIVGVTIIYPEDDYEYLRAHYSLSDYMEILHHPQGSHGIIVHSVMSPLFQRHARFFLKEIHRQSNMSALYYQLYPEQQPFGERGLATVLNELIPVRPRRRPEIYPNESNGAIPDESVLRTESPFALYIMNVPYCSIPKIDVNTRIVIIGASSTAMAFLEALLLGPSSKYLSFNNITLISPHGLAHSKPPQIVRDMFLPFRGRYCYRYTHLMSLQTYINVTYGVLTAIDRKEKYITVSDNKIVAYDLLFLFCGTQFLYSKIPLSSSKGCTVSKSLKKSRENELPENVFVINTEVDVSSALVQLKSIIGSNVKYTIIVYGWRLEAYLCLAALRHFGIHGRHILFIEPFPPLNDKHTVSLFNDCDVENIVMNAIYEEGIVVKTGYYLVEWDIDYNSGRIKSANFESRFQFMEVSCIAMFYYDNKGVCTRTSSAIIQAGLVYDGLLVIDPYFHTNDPFIYSAGPMTKYARKYYTEHIRHAYFCSVEIGEKLGDQIRNMLDPTYQSTDRAESSKNMLTPHFTQPLIFSCVLPGDIHYLYIRKPGSPVPIDAAMNYDDYGQVFMTGDSKSLDRGFFRLHLNSHKIVETITCLSKEKIDVNNMISLWGKHEKMLNNFVARFEMVLITDLFEYFREPWTCALFHDRYSNLLRNIRRRLTSTQSLIDSNVPKTLYQDILDAFTKNEWKKLTKNQKSMIEEKYKLEFPGKIEQLLLDFIWENQTHLPMYAHPLFIKQLLQGCNSSPLHYLH